MTSFLKSTVSTVALATFLASPATASDLFNGSVKDAPGEVVSYRAAPNFTGFYIGGRAGYGNANHDLSLDVFYEEDETVKSGELLGLDGLNSSGFIGGGQVGFDKQMGRFVVGVFGSYDFSNMETTLDIGNGFPEGVGYSLEKEYEWDAGIRAGVLVNPSTLVYALAAYTETEYSLNGPGVSDAEGLDSEKTFSGVKVGGGIEFAATNNIFLGLEGTHTFYGEETWFSSCEDGCSGSDIQVNDELSETKIMGTLKIKLNSGIGGF